MTIDGKAIGLARQGSGRAVHPDSIECVSAVGSDSQRHLCKHLRRRGVISVWVALLSFVMLLFVGLLIDTGKLALNLHQLQNAADAAALAGALVVKSSSPDFTRQKTHDIGFANAAEGLEVTLRVTPQPEPFTGDQTPYDILLGRWVRYNHTFVPTLDAPNAVKAIPRRHTDLGPAAPALRLIFGPIAGVDTANAAREAVAFSSNSGGAGLIALSPTAEPGLIFTGTADLDIDGGGVHVNSTAIGHNRSDGSWVSGNALLDAGFFNTVGGISPAPDDPVWEDIFEGGDDMVDGFPVMDYRDDVQPIDDPVAAQMQGHPYLDPTGTHLDLPGLLDSQGGPIPTRYVTWNKTLKTYEPTLIPNDVTIGLDNDGNNVDATYKLEPGYYPNGMSLRNGDEITLAEPAAGATTAEKLFMFGGGTDPTSRNVGLYMTDGVLTGHGVTCYVTQTYDNTGTALGVCGRLRITGGTVDLDSPGDWQNQQNGTFELSLVEGLNGIAIWQDPTMIDPYSHSNPAGPPEVHLNGNGNFSITGTIYLPDPIHLQLNGDLGDTGNQVLCGSAEISGTATVNIDYDGRNSGDSTTRSCLVW